MQTFPVISEISFLVFPARNIAEISYLCSPVKCPIIFNFLDGGQS